MSSQIMVSMRRSAELKPIEETLVVEKTKTMAIAVLDSQIAAS